MQEKYYEYPKFPQEVIDIFKKKFFCNLLHELVTILIVDEFIESVKSHPQIGPDRQRPRKSSCDITNEMPMRLHDVVMTSRICGQCALRKRLNILCSQLESGKRALPIG